MTEREKLKQAITTMVDKELEKYNITHEDIEKLPKDEYGRLVVGDKIWQDYYTFDSDEECEEFEKWCVNYLRTGKLKWNKAMAEHEVGYFMLGYGLSVKQNKKE